MVSTLLGQRRGWGTEAKHVSHFPAFRSLDSDLDSEATADEVLRCDSDIMLAGGEVAPELSQDLRPRGLSAEHSWSWNTGAERLSQSDARPL